VSNYIITKEATFSVSYAYAPGASDPATLASITITSGLLDAAGGYHPLTVTKAVDNMSFTLSSDTDDWSVGQATYDVRLQFGAVTQFFPKTAVNVSKGITQ
jgi:hypothetical protein